MKIHLKCFIILFFTVFLTGCVGTSTEMKEPDQMEMDHIPGSNSQIEQTEEQQVLNEGSIINVEVSNYAFSPKKITVRAGDTVRINLINNEGSHDFVIDELNVQSKFLEAGESEELEFKVPEDAKGKTFEYYCSILNHRKMGMVGELIVE